MTAATPASGELTRARPPAMPIRLALLGCGAAARMHARTLRRFGAEVRCSFASRNAGRAARFARELGGASSFGSYHAALESPEIDAAVVLTPPALHLDLTLEALRAGKDVIVEKPPFLHAADFDVVEQAAASAGRRVMIAENYFYKPLAVRLRSILASGELGDVRFIDVKALKMQRTRDWRDEGELAGGGALYEGGIHWIDLLANLGPELLAVHGFYAGATAGLDRSMLVVADYAGGAIGTLFFSWETPSPLRGLRLSRIFGSRGSVAFESNGLIVVTLGRRRRVLFPGVRDLAGYGAMFRDYLDALRGGREPGFTLARARRDLELVEEAYRTADGHRRAAGAREQRLTRRTTPPDASRV